jgi:hypothetical protein
VCLFAISEIEAERFCVTMPTTRPEENHLLRPQVHLHQKDTAWQLPQGEDKDDEMMVMVMMMMMMMMTMVMMTKFLR